MLNMKSVILLVLFVNIIYCKNEVADVGITVNDQTETIEVTTLNDNITTSSTSEKPTDPPTTTIKPTTSTNAPSTSKTTTTTTPSPTPPPSSTTTKPNTTSKIPIVPTTPAPAPHKDRHFDGASFIGGIILAVGLMGIGFIAFKFYKARTERNYHTL